MKFDESLSQLKEMLSEEYNFRQATDDELEGLNELAGGRLTDEMLAYFSAFGLDKNERALYGNIAIYGAEHLIRFMKDGVPESTVLPFGFFCIASYINGDAICVDLEDDHHPVYHFPIELINDGDTIDMWIDGESKSFPLNRENALLASCRLAPSFEWYIEYLRQRIGLDPYTVTYIQDKAIEELELRKQPDGISLEIEDGVLKKCRISKLVTTVKVPEGVTAIGESAFSSQAVREVYIPDSVTEIGSNAFKFCTSLDSVRLPETITELPERMFFGCYSLKNITIPESVRTLGSSCFYGCYSLDEIRRPAGVREIGDNCFEECTGLTHVVIPRGVERVSWAAFSKCSELRSVFIPDSVTVVEQNAFANCGRLTKLRWEGRVDAVELSAKSNDDIRKAVRMLNQRSLGESFDTGLRYPLVIGMYRETGSSDALVFIKKNYKKMARNFIENGCEENVTFLAQHSELSAKSRLNELIKLAEQCDNQRICDILIKMK